MEGYTAWYKYQTQAAIHVYRWNPKFSKSVWDALSALLTKSRGSKRRSSRRQDSGSSPIHTALILSKTDKTALAKLAQQLGVGEEQLWALLIVRADENNATIDQLTDARDRVNQIIARRELLLQQSVIPNVNLAVATRQKQADRAKKGRNVIEDSGEKISVKDIVIGMLKVHPDLSAKELWPIFVSHLDSHHLDPVERALPDGTSECWYDLRGKNKTLKFKSFEAKLARLRNKN